MSTYNINIEKMPFTYLQRELCIVSNLVKLRDEIINLITYNKTITSWLHNQEETITDKAIKQI